MNALATHVGDGRWVVETPRPVAEVDKVVTVPSPSMMFVSGAGPMQPMAAVWPQDGAWVAPLSGAAPGVVTGQGVGAPFMQVPSEPWFEGAGELAEVPEADDHGGCGTNGAFEAAYLAAAAEASARGVIEPRERREALIDALMEEAVQAERAKFEAMVASGEVKVWEDDEDETRFDPQGQAFRVAEALVAAPRRRRGDGGRDVFGDVLECIAVAVAAAIARESSGPAGDVERDGSPAPLWAVVVKGRFRKRSVS
jgi:hypothetical protein